MERSLPRRIPARWYGGLLLVMGLLAVGPAAAQPVPRVDVRLSVDSVKVGERFALTLVAEHGANTTAVFPPATTASALFGDLHVVRRGPVQTRRRGGTRQVDSVTYEVTTFALDSARVPILPVRLVAAGDTTVAGTFPHVVGVESVVPPDAKGLRAPALLATFPRPAWWWAVLVLVGAALLAGGTYAWWRRHPDDASASATAEAPPEPYEEAAEQLRRLERRHPAGRAACKAFYVDLTETLRVYLARRVGVRALECTTSELVTALHRRPELQEGSVRRLQAVLEQADLVKFADAQPPPEESQSVLRDAQGVLDAIEAAQRRTEHSASEESAPA